MSINTKTKYLTTQVANSKIIIIPENFIPRNYRSLVNFTDFLSVQTLRLAIFSIETRLIDTFAQL